MKASSEISSRSKPRAAPPRTAPSFSSTAERFTLSGPSLALDPSIHAYRPDIADIALAGQLFAPHYARPLIRIAGAGARGLFSSASTDALPVSELEEGDEFALLDISGDWAWGYRRLDHRVGYVPEIHLLETDGAG